MKKYIILVLCILNSLNGMEMTKRESREWDAQTYDEGNQFQTETFLHFLTTNKITTHNKTILDIGCGTGKIAARLAKNAAHIHLFDASKNMIHFAHKKHKNIPNISFEHCFAEDFQSHKKYQLALASFSIQWIEDKQQAFCQIYNSLETNGEFFAIIKTTNNPSPIHLTVFNDMMPVIKQHIIADATTPSNPVGSSYYSEKEYTNMLQEAGFEIIKNEEQCFSRIMTQEQLIKFQWPLFVNRPIMKNISQENQKLLFTEFMNRYMKKLTKIDAKCFLNKIIINVVHARKIEK